jgi:FAD/FMN-containing dehydrogenase
MSQTAPEQSSVDELRRSLDGDVVTRADADWDSARLAWNLFVDQRPAAVALPESAADVAAVVRFARDAGYGVAAQSTGHGASAHRSLDGTVLLNMARMTDVEIDPVARRARVGAGALWESVVEPASPIGLAALHGSSPDVGVVGYSLGGGIGWLPRKHGLAANSITAVELVTADGELVRADRDHEPDLFWALRGGGGNFGAVTALEFALYPLESAYAGWLIFPWEESERVLKRWSEWTATVPDEMTSIGRILQLPAIPAVPKPLRGRQIVVVEAAYAGDAETGAHLMRPLRELGPEIDTFATVPPFGLVRLHADPEGPTPGVGDGGMLDVFPGEAVEALVASAGPGSGSALLSVEVRHLGGALARPSTDAGALSHLDGQFLLFSVGLPMEPEQGAVIEAQVDVVSGALEPFGRGRKYLNLAERPTDTRSAHSELAYRRLQRVRDAVDPNGLFRANHAIS